MPRVQADAVRERNRQSRSLRARSCQTLGVSTTSADPAASVPHPPARHRRNRILAILVTIVLVVAVMVAWPWWTHPKAFGGLGDGYESNPRPLEDSALSTTVVFPKIKGAPETVTIRSLDAAFSENTAKAGATFWICHMTAGEDPIGAVFDPEATCADMEKFTAPMRFEHGVRPDSDYLFVTITPTRSGVAKLESVDIDYSRSKRHLYQRGTETIAADRVVTVR
ncbi:hypothetical protein [Aeromicrobium sp. MLTX1]|uniref:hypothetical protein n=1 Tax=Aeromicrobium sp. MLTX1 TaxID=3389799 RepID=UPI00396B34E0